MPRSNARRVRAEKFPMMMMSLRQDTDAAALEFRLAGEIMKIKHRAQYDNAVRVLTKALEKGRSLPEDRAAPSLAIEGDFYGQLTRLLAETAEVRERFPGDNYDTVFRRVGENIMAYEPAFPDGRKVANQDEVMDWEAVRAYWSDEDNLTNPKTVLGHFFIKMIGVPPHLAIDLYQRLMERARGSGGILIVLVTYACMAFQLCEQHRVLIQKIEDWRFAEFAAPDGTPKDVVREIACLLSVFD